MKSGNRGKQPAFCPKESTYQHLCSSWIIHSTHPRWETTHLVNYATLNNVQHRPKERTKGILLLWIFSPKVHFQGLKYGPHVVFFWWGWTGCKHYIVKLWLGSGFCIFVWISISVTQSQQVPASWKELQQYFLHLTKLLLTVQFTHYTQLACLCKHVTFVLCQMQRLQWEWAVGPWKRYKLLMIKGTTD